MTYNPAIHHRHSIRLKGYGYSQAGMYFVTICCKDIVCRFTRKKIKTTNNEKTTSQKTSQR